MIRTLEKRIVLFALLALTIVIVVNTTFNVESYRLDYRDSLLLRSHSLAKGLQGSIDKVLDLGLPLDELSGIDERCAVIVDSDPEIAYCLVEDSTGKVLFGSLLATQAEFSSAQMVEASGSHVIISISGLGDYFDIQQPLYTSNGDVAGRVRIGFPVQVLTDKAAVLIRRSIVVLIGAFGLACLLIILFVKRDVVKPMRLLEQIASDIAGGNFAVTIPPMATRELEQLGRSLGAMAASLKSRDDEIQQNYIVLEESNKQLRDSYNQQELIGQELGRSREMYRSLLDDASDAIIVSDEENRIVLINKAAEALFAISRDRAETQTLIEFLIELEAEEAEGITNLFINVLHGQSLETEIRFIRPSDKQALIGWAKCSSVLGRDGMKVVQTSVRDVTREREVTANLEHSARELERLNTMKDSFLGVASHELKTPLTVILGYTELLLGEMSELVGEQALPMIEHINRSAERLSVIVRDMVDVTLLDNQNIRLRCHEVVVEKLVMNVAAEVEYFLDKRKQELVLDLSDELTEIWCDEERMNQVLTNLITNAIKFTPDGGTITITTRYLESHRSQAGAVKDDSPDGVPNGDANYAYAQISISDNGIGIAEKDQLHIFDKFYEVGEIGGHFTAKSAFKGKGTGLGLTIAKGFVELHEGVIWVESDGYDPDNCPGSTFFILIPVAGNTPGFSSQKLRGI